MYPQRLHPPGLLSFISLQVSVAVDALRREGVPFVSVLSDPTYGGVSASYAMQADVRVAVGSARIGFAGPAVILNTMFEMDQSKFDEACPENFQVTRGRRGDDHAYVGDI